MSDPIFRADAERIVADMEARRITVAESMQQWAMAVSRAIERRQQSEVVPKKPRKRRKDWGKSKGEKFNPVEVAILGGDPSL